MTRLTTLETRGHGDTETRGTSARHRPAVSPHRRNKWLLSALCFLLMIAGTAASQATASIRGIVTDAEGRPLAGVRVGVIDQASAVMRETHTDAAGRFQVDGLEPDRKNRVVAIKFGYQMAALENVSPTGDELTISLRPHLRRPLRAAPAPTSPALSSPTAVPVVELTTSLVLLSVSVKDAKGNPVPDLKKSNFTLYEDGVPQEIVSFEEENAPLSVVLLMDVSDSMEGSSLQEAKRAAIEFIDQSQPQNEIALIAFNDQVHTLRAFTHDRAPLRAAIEQLIASGGTALYDALASAIELMLTARYPRHVIVLLSDGQDEDSRRKFSQVERLVQSTDVVIFAVGEYTEAEHKAYMMNKKYYKEPALDVNLNPVWVLRQLSDISGGRAFFPLPAEPLEPLFALIARELRHQYGLGYIPPARSGKPKFHTIEVRVKHDARPGPLKVRTRKGYFE
ncbi:MAG: VWA domain-containing protein [Acidobacteria bacterium]|nr:VWA domain-containing protein [Acidobacteriota bacterium]